MGTHATRGAGDQGLERTATVCSTRPAWGSRPSPSGGRLGRPRGLPPEVADAAPPPRFAPPLGVPAQPGARARREGAGREIRRREGWGWERGVTSKQRRQRAGARTSLRTPGLAAAGQGRRRRHRRDLDPRSLAVGEYDRAAPFLKVTGLKGAESGAWGSGPGSPRRACGPGTPSLRRAGVRRHHCGFLGLNVPPPRPQWNSPYLPHPPPQCLQPGPRTRRCALFPGPPGSGRFLLRWTPRGLPESQRRPPSSSAEECSSCGLRSLSHHEEAPSPVIPFPMSFGFPGMYTLSFSKGPHFFFLWHFFTPEIPCLSVLISHPARHPPTRGSCLFVHFALHIGL